MNESVNLANLDLNLLVALRALLQERNVTRAAERVGLSQPAMSAALARLRRHFDDALLVRIGNRFELSALGRDLVGQTEAACHMVDRVFTAQAGFDPATTRREFTIMTSDYPLAVLSRPLTEALRARAPGVRLRFPRMNDAAMEDIDTTLRSIDGMFMPHGFITDQPDVDLYRDRWVCVTADDHPTVGEHLTMDDVRRLPWV